MDIKLMTLAALGAILGIGLYIAYFGKQIGAGLGGLGGGIGQFGQGIQTGISALLSPQITPKLAPTLGMYCVGTGPIAKVLCGTPQFVKNALLGAGSPEMQGAKDYFTR